MVSDCRLRHPGTLKRTETWKTNWFSFCRYGYRRVPECAISVHKKFECWTSGHKGKNISVAFESEENRRNLKK